MTNVLTEATIKKKSAALSTTVKKIVEHFRRDIIGNLLTGEIEQKKNMSSTTHLIRS